jgi:NAD(P)-dependent dehydrogenase (short-subunit alcohol dehydrogenase family)
MVTGANSGIGFEIARQLLAEGFAVLTGHTTQLRAPAAGRSVSSEVTSTGEPAAEAGPVKHRRCSDPQSSQPGHCRDLTDSRSLPVTDGS